MVEGVGPFGPLGPMGPFGPMDPLAPMGTLGPIGPLEPGTDTGLGAVVHGTEGILCCCCMFWRGKLPMLPDEAAAETGSGVVGKFGGIGFLKPARGCIPGWPIGGPGRRGMPWGGMGILLAPGKEDSICSPGNRMGPGPWGPPC